MDRQQPTDSDQKYVFLRVVVTFPIIKCFTVLGFRFSILRSVDVDRRPSDIQVFDSALILQDSNSGRNSHPFRVHILSDPLLERYFGHYHFQQLFLFTTRRAYDA